METITASVNDADKRLDKFLAENLRDTTRSQIKKMIKDGLVLVNGQIPSVHQFLKENDKIEIKEKEPLPPASLPDISILKKGDGYIVIDKPAGVLTHQTRKRSSTPVLTDWLVKKFPQCASVGDPARPGIVHRLDRDTSGVMIIATSQEMYDCLKRQFQQRSVKKTYLALVHGHLHEQSGRIDRPIGRSKANGHMAARTKAVFKKDREAVTDYQVIKRYKKFDLVKASPLTGRMHQIRVHFKSMGNPVVGDKIYIIRRQKKIMELGRLFLHASQLTFIDYKGNEQTVSSPLPTKLQEFLNTIV